MCLKDNRGDGKSTLKVMGTVFVFVALVVLLSSVNAFAAVSSETLSALSKLVEKQGEIPVIVGFKAEFSPEGSLSVFHAANQRSAIARGQENVLASLTVKGFSPRGVKRFETIPYLALRVNTDELAALVADGNVISIQEDRINKPLLPQSVPLIGGANLVAEGATGSGQVVAVLDTGVDKTHSFLTGKVVSEACYSSNYAPHNATTVCPGGVTESTATGSGVPCSVNGCDHGTHVAGIVAGRGTIDGAAATGVAPDAGIIAVQVFSRFDNDADCDGNAPCARTYDSDWMKGLERVYNLRNTYNIAAVNMSLGGGQYFNTCDVELTAQKALIDNLRSVGIATIIASGNEGYVNSIGSPACISTAVSVGATTKNDQVARYSNSASFLTLLAPGGQTYDDIVVPGDGGIKSSVPGGTFEGWQGTSMAAPHVAGAFAAVRSKVSSASVTEIVNALINTGVAVTDDRNNITKSRIQVDQALDALVTITPTGTVTPTLSPTPQPGGGGGGGGCSTGVVPGMLLLLVPLLLLRGKR